MAPELLRTLLAWLKVLAPAFTRPGFANAVIIFCGWVQTTGAHAITQALVASRVAGRRHHEAFHRFFSRGTWSPDSLGRLLYERAVEHLVESGVTIDLVLDDTLTPKKGPRVFGLGTHIDAVRSTRRFRVFTFGHVWVVLSIVVRVPFSRRPWALPILFRLYRTKKDCQRRRGGKYSKKTEFARDMVRIVAAWVPAAKLRISADSAYANDTVLRGLPSNVMFVGAMRPDAVLTALPTAADQKKTGRRRVRGKLLPKPCELAKSRKQRWKKHRVFTYGAWRTLECKMLDAQWYQGAGTRLIRVVIVRVPRGDRDIRVFFTTDVTMSVEDVLQIYAGRWSTEVAFRDLKQLLGFGDSQARTRNAVERTAPFVGLAFTTLVLWFSQGVHRTPLAAPPVRPWYPHKRGRSFADILRTAQRVLATTDVLDLASNLDNFREHGQADQRASPMKDSHAA